MNLVCVRGDTSHTSGLKRIFGETVVKMPCDVASDVHSCEEGWTKFEGNCYLHFSTRENWLDAEQRCQDLNAHLVSIITPEEQAFISCECVSMCLSS